MLAKVEEMNLMGNYCLKNVMIEDYLSEKNQQESYRNMTAILKF